MRCLACVANSNPAPPGDIVMLGLAYGARLPELYRARIIESLCEKHRRDFEEGSNPARMVACVEALSAKAPTLLDPSPRRGSTILVDHVRRGT